MKQSYPQGNRPTLPVVRFHSTTHCKIPIAIDSSAASLGQSATPDFSLTRAIAAAQQLRYCDNGSWRSHTTPGSVDCIN